MEFYYCKSKWEHLVISAKSAIRAKHLFLIVINARLDNDKRLVSKDVTVEPVRVFMDDLEGEE